MSTPGSGLPAELHDIFCAGGSSPTLGLRCAPSPPNGQRRPSDPCRQVRKLSAGPLPRRFVPTARQPPDRDILHADNRDYFGAR